jgi:hypothetical protein
MSWHKYWLIWFVLWFVVGFLPVEFYCMAKRNGGTLSETIWWLEGYKPGDVDFADIAKWTAGHVLFGGVLSLVLLWLVGHFLLRWWH